MLPETLRISAESCSSLAPFSWSNSTGQDSGSEEKKASGESRSRAGYTCAIPRNEANSSGMPNSLIVTWPVAVLHALRTRRISHERRAWARCARERIASAGGSAHDDGRWHAHLDSLVPHQVQAGTPVLSATPIPPKQRCGAHLKRMKEHTDSARLGRRIPMPLTLGAHGAIATVADSSAVEHAQTAIRFPALLRGSQRLARRTLYHPVRLEGEVLPRKAPRLPRQSDDRRDIALHWSLLYPCFWAIHNGGGKLGRTHGLRLELMAQFVIGAFHTHCEIGTVNLLIC